MAKGPLTDEGKANISAGQRARYARIMDRAALGDAVAEAVREGGERAAARAVRKFAQDRPESLVVRLMGFGDGEEEEC